MKQIHPIGPNGRVESIDILRGVALLGILLINIVGMGLPDPSYFDPSAYGGDEGWNLKVFFVNSMFFEGTMRALFSLLFGAGVVMFFRHKDASLASIEVWFRRLLWLIPMGMFHAYILLWPGDVLFAYGMIGLFLFPLRKLHPNKMLFLSIFVLLIGVWLNVQDLKTARNEQKQYFEALSLINRGQEVPYDTLMPYYNWIERYAVMKPSQVILESRADNHRKGYRKAFKENKPYARFYESEYHYRHNYTDIFSMMLLGMALFKWRILQAGKSKGFYVVMMLVGYGLGLSVNYLETRAYVQSHFDLIKYYELLRTYDLGRVATVMGHIGLVMLFCKISRFDILKRALAAVGKMALSNYLMHSFIALIIFVGFGQYGLWQRYELYYLVFAIWVVQLVLSPLWLRYFRFGPWEWVWRALSYWEMPQFKKKK